ncbi:FG-GAP repeat domain-containing protein [Frankia tisae]|uniref:FG-GAP repeat domain-containing protein n=1 Tax=Frankia tisae TaxID=2950104 RepID=UPI0021BEEA44|nr:VCBS repeat-containing protein [Frankia tisae]
MSALEPDELTRLLTEAVEPIRPSPEAYRQIRAGIARRRRWRIPAFTLGGMVMAALIGLAVVAIRPSPSSQVVEPAAPPVMPTTFSEPSRAATVPSLGGGSGHPSSGGGGSAPGSTTRVPTSPLPTRPTASASSQSVAPTSPQSSAPSNSTGPGSPQLPTPVAKPAAANDIDGDGQPDTVAPDGTNLRVRFSRDGQVARVALGSIITPLNSAVIDIDGDGFGELLVQTQAAGGTKSYALLRYASLDELAVLTLPSDLALGAGVRGNSALGFRCADKTLQISTGTSSDGTQFNVATTTLGFTPDGLAVQDTASSTVRLPADSSPFVVSCGALS